MDYIEGVGLGFCFWSQVQSLKKVQWVLESVGRGELRAITGGQTGWRVWWASDLGEQNDVGHLEVGRGIQNPI